MTTEDLDDVRLIEFADPELGVTLPMEVMVELEKDGKTFALLTPSRPEVMIVREDGESGEDEEGELTELDAEAFATISKHVREALKPLGLAVEAFGEILLLTDEVPVEFFEDFEAIRINYEHGEEDVPILQEIDTGEETYLILLPEMPLTQPVELLEDGSARALSDEEYAPLEESFREALSDLLESEEAADEEGD